MMQDLGTLPLGTDSCAFDATLDGSVIVGISRVPTGNLAFVWSQSMGMQALSILPGSQSSHAASISDNGQVVVGSCYFSDGGNKAVRWSIDGDVQFLNTVPFTSESIANAVSADGTVIVGQYSSISGWRAFRWNSETGMQDLGLLDGGSWAVARAVSSDGSVVVGECFIPGSGSRAFRWTFNAGMQDLDSNLPPGTNSSAFAVSSDGTVVAGRSENAAFRWTIAEGIRTFAGTCDTRSWNSHSWATSNDGRVIVGSHTNSSSTPYRRAFHWKQNSGPAKDLGSLFGSDMIIPYGVSGDGSVVVGYSGGVNGGRAFRWVACTSCSADFNADGVVDFFDYLDFVADFSSRACRSDFNGDREQDFFDYLDFVAAFSAGC